VALELIARVRDLTLAPPQKLLLFALASRANRADRCWPSVARVCRDTGLSRRAVQIHLGHLATRGLVVRDGRYGRSNIYRLTLDGFGDASSGPSEQGIAERRQTALERMPCAPQAHEMRTPAHGVPPPGALGAPEVPREVSLRKQRKPSGEQAPVDNPHASEPWWRSRPAVMQRGKELGLAPRPGEAYGVYKDRVYRASVAVKFE
jgi:Helix-turn-helix domain